MKINYCFFDDKFFLWPVIRFIVNYSKILIFSYLFLLVVIYFQAGNLSILIAALSTFIAVILYAKNLKLYIESHQDQLTGLENKNSLIVHLEREISRIKRNGGYLTLLFFDIDNFKSINDTYGHKAGDCVLIEVAHRLMGKMRNYDKLIRYGGDEFCVICSQLKSEADSWRIQEKLYDALHFVHVIKNKEISIETSLGMATYPVDTQNAHDLVTIADQRMYEQKKKRKLTRISMATVNE